MDVVLQALKILYDGTFKSIKEIEEYFTDHKMPEINYYYSYLFDEVGEITEHNCPFCGGSYGYIVEPLRFKCARCYKKYSPFRKTILDNSKLPLKTWYFAIWLVANNKISSIKLAEALNLTQPTAYYIKRKITQGLKQQETGLTKSGD